MKAPSKNKSTYSKSCFDTGSHVFTIPSSI
jgi:hypothetical protein